MKRLFTSTAVCLIACNLATADTYETEVTGEYIQLDDSFFGVPLDADGFSIGGTYYLDPVDNSHGPLAEASFLDRASGISLDFASLSEDATDIDASAHNISGHFVSKDTGWLFGIGFVNVDIDNPDLDADQLSLTLGRYISENTSITFGWDHLELGEGDDQLDVDSYQIAVKHVAKHSSGMDHSVEAFLGGVNLEGVEENGLTYGGSYTLYPSRNFGIGASLAITDSEGLDTTSYSVFADWFITENATVGVTYLKTDVDEIDDNGNVLGVTASVRF